MRMHKATALVAILLFAGIAAAVCPEGAADCFNCGAGPSSIACTKNCTGKWSERAHAYVSCECPQGEPCACYCPYMPTLSDECLLDPACVAKQLPVVRGVMGYVAKIEGKAQLVKAGTGDKLELTPLTVINPGDKIVMESEYDTVTVVFDCGNIRTFRGEGDVTIDYSTLEEEIRQNELEMNGHLWMYYVGKRLLKQIEMNPKCTPAYTICGGGGFSNPDFIAYIEKKRYMREHGCVHYDIESEVLFEINNGTQTVKVIEGKVTATDIDGNTLIVRTGEQAIIADGDVGGASKAKFDYRVEPNWWARGFEGTCSSTCAKNELQTPFPGCSCVAESGSGSGCSSGLILLVALGTLLIAHPRLTGNM